MQERNIYYLIYTPIGKKDNFATFIHCFTNANPTTELSSNNPTATVSPPTIMPPDSTHNILPSGYLSTAVTTSLPKGFHEVYPILKHFTAHGYPTIVSVSSIAITNHTNARAAPAKSFHTKLPIFFNTQIKILTPLVCVLA